MRSNTTNSAIKRSTKRSKSRLPLALTAIVAVFALGSVADAAQRMGASGGFAGHSAGGFAAKISGGALRGITRLPGNSGGKPSTAGNNSADGGRHSGGHSRNDRPHKPRFPKDPIIVRVPTTVTAVTPALGAVNPSGGGATTSARIVARTRGSVPPANERRYRPDEVLTQFASSLPNETIDALGRRLRLNRVASFTSNDVTMSRWTISDRRPVPAVIRSLEAERIVLAAQPNYIYQLQQQLAPADEPPAAALLGQGDTGQYALAKLRLREAHELAKGDKVLIAVIDSGVDLAHPELAGMVVDSFDALDSDEKAHAHGTAVAGAIVAHVRLMGAAPAARILAARAFSAKERTPEATTYSISQSIDWALARGARIINMSFTGPRDPSIEQRMAHARKQGLVLIAAVGNAGPKSRPLYPAAYPNVIAVTATDADDALFAGASRGDHIAVAAPGVDLLLPAPEAGYQVTTGTSFAAAEVSGIAALLLERKPDLGYDGVRRALTATARDLGPKGIDLQFGAGLVDAYRAILSLEPTTTGTTAKAVPASSQ